MRRNVDVAKHRLKMMKKRVPRFRRLRRIGISTSRLLRAGAKAAMTYGQNVLGVSNSLLRDQRRTAAVISAPESGIGGQNLDLALILADENATLDLLLDSLAAVKNEVARAVKRWRWRNL